MRDCKKQGRVKSSTRMVLAAVVAVTLAMPGAALAEPTAADKQAEAQTALASLNSLQDNLNQASNDYVQAQSEVEAAQANMEEAQGRIDDLNARIDDLQVRLGDRANSMYRNGSLTFLDLLFGAASFEEFATSWDLLEKMNQSDADLVQEAKDLSAQVEAEKAEYARQETIASEKAEEARVKKEEAAASAAAMQETYDSLSAEAAELLAQEQAAQEVARAAAAQAAIEQNAQTSNQNTGGGSGSSNAGGSGGVEPPYNAVTGNAIVDRAYSYVGNAEYVSGACAPGQFDCSGFVSYCLTGSYSRLGSTYTFLGWSRTNNPQPGDIAVNEGHCGIYIGGGQMIHAASPGQGVCIGGVQSGMVYVRY
ncbi:coiled-coil domain-containing protein [Raoultibacter phocaeensis]|uniref:coiled-coil domain-containing protein n=1 Tax=Raoultibacter phocaeensis TaxID=2479841 RepID=UPI0015D5E2FB|nr:NlpC/P60 family protein [Raoultibacter phocaeensis]